MEEKRGISTYFTGIVRLIAFILLVLIILFFIFRWAGNRRAENRAEEAVKTAVNESESDESSNEEASRDEAPGDSSTGVVEVPSGISDSEAARPSDTSAPTQSVPSVGIGENIILTTLLISTAAYLISKNYNLHKQLR